MLNVINTWHVFLEICESENDLGSPAVVLNSLLTEHGHVLFLNGEMYM